MVNLEFEWNSSLYKFGNNRRLIKACTGYGSCLLSDYNSSGTTQFFKANAFFFGKFVLPHKSHRTIGFRPRAQLRNKVDPKLIPLIGGNIWIKARLKICNKVTRISW